MFELIWKKIIRREPYSLWDIPAFLLWLCSFPYRLGAKLHRLFAGTPEKISAPVLSIGNITVGGTGKTPLVAFIARDLINDGFRVGIVSSGYGRIDETAFLAPGYQVRDMSVSTTGDEIMLLAGMLPDAVFSVNRFKTQAARTLADSGRVDLIIVDDGFQHHKLSRDIDVVAYDAGLKRRLLKPFPYGMLREPRSALRRADVIIITRAKFALDINAIRRDLKKISPRAKIFHAGFVAENLVGAEQTLSVKYAEDKSVFLFAGIGNFRSLERQVSALSGDLDFALEFSDHQVYEQTDLKRIKRLADKYDSDLILTTHKDWVKLGNFDFGREIYYLDLTVDLDPGEEKLLEHIKNTLHLPGGEN